MVCTQVDHIKKCLDFEVNYIRFFFFIFVRQNVLLVLILVGHVFRRSCFCPLKFSSLAKHFVTFNQQNVHG